jgi:hypothetical protein
MFQVPQPSNPPTPATDMSDTDVCIVGVAGGGCCYSYLYDFDRFCARDVFIICISNHLFFELK